MKIEQGAQDETAGSNYWQKLLESFSQDEFDAEFVQLVAKPSMAGWTVVGNEATETMLKADSDGGDQAFKMMAEDREFGFGASQNNSDEPMME